LVTNKADNGPGTLRSALATAANGDLIRFSLATPATILLVSNELFVQTDVSVIGPGPGSLIIDGNSTNRVFHIASNTVVCISGLTVSNGLAQKAGGIYNEAATLTVSNCWIVNNRAWSGEGGGIFSLAVATNAYLKVTNCSVVGNWSYSYGGGISSEAWSGMSATVEVGSTVLTGNYAMGYGGGILSMAEAGVTSVRVVASTLTGNTAGESGGGIEHDGYSSGQATMQIINSELSGNVADEYGGGIDIQAAGGSANTEIDNSMINSNAVANGFGGGIMNNGGQGGTSKSSLCLSNCTLSGNWVLDNGGAICNYGAFGGNGNLLITSSTLYGNSAGYYGGGIYSDGTSGNAIVRVVSDTLAENLAGYTGNAIYNNGGSTSTVDINNTILEGGDSGGTLGNSGVVTSLGYNLSSDDAAGLLNSIGDQTNADPMLGPLQANGGLTLTCALLPGSPAIDNGDGSLLSPPWSLEKDQRGLPRESGSGIDIGAFEVQWASNPFTISSLTRLADGRMQMSATNRPGASLSMLATTNLSLPLSAWSVLGPAAEISPGYFQFWDPPLSNSMQRFYRLRSP
jgi:hypothetical protein